MRNRLQQLIYAASMTTIFVGYPFFARAACPDGYVQVGEQREETADAIIIHPVCQAVAAPKPAPKPAPAHPVPDLAKDPDAARMGAAQLKIDNDRITMLKKEIALLSDDNPEWAKERDIAMDDLRDDGIGITEEGFNLMVLGLDKLVNGQAKEAVTKAFTEASAKATTGIMAQLSNDEATVRELAKTTNNPAVRKATEAYLAAVDRLRAADITQARAEILSRLREAVETCNNELDLIKGKRFDSLKFSEALYISSASIGGLALFFVTGDAKIVAATGSAVASVGLAGREVYNAWQDYKRVGALEQQSSQRNQMKTELVRRLDVISNERDLIASELPRAGSTN